MNALHPLGQLIQSVEDSKGWTMREIARRAERAQVPLSNAYLGKLKRQGIRSITIETIHALAVGLDLPERIVATAALETMGVHDIGTAETGAAVAIARDPDLSERDRRILLAVVREMHGERTEQQPASGERSAPPGPSTATAGGSAVEDPGQPDGITPAADAATPDTSRGVPDAGANAYVLDRGYANETTALADLVVPEPRREDYDRAADDSGPSLLEADDARAATRGEESQDPEDWT